MSEKVYYYLKLEETYFNSKIEKALRKMPSGAEMLICYLKMQLKYIRSEGFINYSGIYKTLEEEIALEIDEDVQIVQMTLISLTEWGYIDKIDNGLYLKDLQKRVGSKTDVALRVEKHRKKIEMLQSNNHVTTGNKMLTPCRDRDRDRDREDIDKEIIPETKEVIKEKRNTVFYKPSISEIEDYLLTEKITSFTAEAFYDHYEIAGWKYGKSHVPIKDWKAAVRTWERNGKKFDVKPKQEPLRHSQFRRG